MEKIRYTKKVTKCADCPECRYRRDSNNTPIYSGIGSKYCVELGAVLGDLNVIDPDCPFRGIEDNFEELLADLNKKDAALKVLHEVIEEIRQSWVPRNLSNPPRGHILVEGGTIADLLDILDRAVGDKHGLISPPGKGWAFMEEPGIYDFNYMALPGDTKEEKKATYKKWWNTLPKDHKEGLNKVWGRSLDWEPSDGEEKPND